jgi:hypothetical protein
VLPLRKTSAFVQQSALFGPDEIVVQAAENSARIAWIRPWALAVTWIGRGEQRIVDAVADALPSMLIGRTPHYFVCDTLAVRGYDMSVRQPAARVLGECKSAGMHDLVVVASNPALRMLAHALGLAVAKRTRVFESREQAVAYCATLP